MDGIEALRAMKEGKTVIMFRRADHHADYTDYYFRLDTRNKFDQSETSKIIWTRARYEKYWHESSNSVKFWIMSDNFEIVRGAIE